MAAVGAASSASGGHIPTHLEAAAANLASGHIPAHLRAAASYAARVETVAAYPTQSHIMPAAGGGHEGTLVLRALCSTPGCDLPAALLYDGRLGEKCNIRCGQAALCTTAGCGKPTYNGKAGEKCRSCVQASVQAIVMPGIIQARPCLYYYPFAGRAELTRLIAAAGGIQIDEVVELADKSSFGSPGSLPCLAHGELRIAQSFAIESYIARIAPMFKALAPSHRAIDFMFCKIKEEMFTAFMGMLNPILMELMDSGHLETKRARAAEKKGKVAEDILRESRKWFPVLEQKLPAAGFLNGLPFPTAADLAVLNIAGAFMPFRAAYAISGYDPTSLLTAKYPKFAAHAERVLQHPSVKAYVERSQTLSHDPCGLNSLPSGSVLKPSQAVQPEVMDVTEPAATHSTSLEQKPAPAPEVPPLPPPIHPPPDPESFAGLESRILQVEELNNPAMGATPAAVSDDSTSHPMFSQLLLDERLMRFNEDRQLDMTRRVSEEVRDLEARQLLLDRRMAELDCQFQGLAEDNDRISHMGSVLDSVGIVERLAGLENREKVQLQFVKKALTYAKTAYEHATGGGGSPRKSRSPPRRTPPVVATGEEADTVNLIEKVQEQDEALQFLQEEIQDLQAGLSYKLGLTPSKGGGDVSAVTEGLVQNLEAQLSGELADLRRQVHDLEEVVDQRCMVPLWQLSRQIPEAGQHVQALSGQCQEFFAKVESLDLRMRNLDSARMQVLEDECKKVSQKVSLREDDYGMRMDELRDLGLLVKSHGLRLEGVEAAKMLSARATGAEFTNIQPRLLDGALPSAPPRSIFSPRNDPPRDGSTRVFGGMGQDFLSAHAPPDASSGYPLGSQTMGRPDFSRDLWAGHAMEGSQPPVESVVESMARRLESSQPPVESVVESMARRLEETRVAVNAEARRLEQTYVPLPEQRDHGEITLEFCGQIGLQYGSETGFVTEVHEGPANNLGVQPGWQIIGIDDLSFDDSLLQRKMADGAVYRIAFLKEELCPASSPLTLPGDEGIHRVGQWGLVHESELLPEERECRSGMHESE